MPYDNRPWTGGYPGYTVGIFHGSSDTSERYVSLHTSKC